MGNNMENLTGRAHIRDHLRRLRQKERQASLTKEELSTNAEACKNYVIFGGLFETHIMTMARLGFMSKRTRRHKYRLSQLQKKRDAEAELEKKLMEKKEQSLMQRATQKAARAMDRAQRVMRKGVA